MGRIEPQEFSYEESEKKTTTEQGTVVEKQKKIQFAPEDIIALAAAIVAILFAVAIIAGKLPANGLTIGVVGFSGAGAVIAKIIKTRRKTAGAKKTK